MATRILLVMAAFIPVLSGPVARPATGAEASGSESVADPDAPFLDDLQERTFRFFWETTNSENGLVPDRWPGGSMSSIAAVGFGLTAYGVGVERGYVKRDEAVERVLTTMRFFLDSPQNADPKQATGHHGFYYHFLEMDTGLRFRDCELSSIDTALLMMGVLFCQEYFDADDPQEEEVRRLADELYRRVEWSWIQPRAPLIGMSWRPERDFGGADYRGYNEAMFLYILALGSPTHPVDASAWDAYTGTYQWKDFYGFEHINFAPLFGHQYSHVWLDFRGITDRYTREKGIDYFENSRRGTLSQRAYAIDNPAGWKGYGENIWGLTACDGPVNAKLVYQGKERQFHTYRARGASAQYAEDDGTISPTAAGGSIPFAPEETIAALRAMRDLYGEGLYQEYGFRDCFNPSFTDTTWPLAHGEILPGLGWFGTDYLGIDQGPILLMAENHRTGFVWEVMKKSPYLREGLKRAGFEGGWLD